MIYTYVYMILIPAIQDAIVDIDYLSVNHVEVIPPSPLWSLVV